MELGLSTIGLDPLPQNSVGSHCTPSPSALRRSGRPSLGPRRLHSPWRSRRGDVDHQAPPRDRPDPPQSGATAMTALTLQELSGGRPTLGLGVSGPQVVEGWHGVPFRSPLASTRDDIAILRKHCEPTPGSNTGATIYSVPFVGEGATGLGRPLRSTVPQLLETPIPVAALGPQEVALAAEVADGILPYLWSPQHWQGLGRRARRPEPGLPARPDRLRRDRRRPRRVPRPGPAAHRDPRRRHG